MQDGAARLAKAAESGDPDRMAAAVADLNETLSKGRGTRQEWETQLSQDWESVADMVANQPEPVRTRWALGRDTSDQYGSRWTKYIQGPNRLLINAAQADKLKALGGRSGVELRFYCVTLTRGHKREEDILKQIYNYDAELDDAKRKDEEARQKGQEARNVWKFGENWRKHYKGRQGKLARFFAEAQACGALYWYESREGKDGKVYRWDKEAKKDTRTETGTEAEN